MPTLFKSPSLSDARTRKGSTWLPDLVAFGLITLTISWAPWIVLDRLRVDLDAGAGFVVFALAAAGPSLAALALRIAGRRKPQGAARTRASWVWPLAAALLGACPAVVAAALVHTGDLGLLGRHAADTIASVGGPAGALAYTMISGPLSEEFGWRGFVQPRLRLRCGPLRTTLLIGTAWGVWHLPLFVMAGTGQHDIGLTSVDGALFFLVLFPISYLCLFVSERLRGGVWAAIMLHASWNLSEALMPDPSTLATMIKIGLFLAVAAVCWLGWRTRQTARAPLGPPTAEETTRISARTDGRPPS